MNYTAYKPTVDQHFCLTFYYAIAFTTKLKYLRKYEFIFKIVLDRYSGAQRGSIH